jgi:hypothetical protein
VKGVTDREQRLVGQELQAGFGASGGDLLDCRPQRGGHDDEILFRHPHRLAAGRVGLDLASHYALAEDAVIYREQIVIPGVRTLPPRLA